jgi:arylsulfatase A-like enzyme
MPKSTITIVCDQQINYKRIPKHILDLMPGYQAFRRKGINFLSISNSRQDCSPSRACLLSSAVNVGIADNIDFYFQYGAVPKLDTSFDTIGKVMVQNGVDTAFWGKSHIMSMLAADHFQQPMFNMNTTRAMDVYGFSKYTVYGDPYYYFNKASFTDNNIFSCVVNNDDPNYDYEDESGRYMGALPYLKSRVGNPKPFHLQVHLSNPHDTQATWMNYADDVPTKPQQQFFMPYLEEQLALINKQNGTNKTNPYIFNNTPEYIENKSVHTNYFEDTFEGYVKNFDSMPFKESYALDYFDASKVLFPYFIGMMESLRVSTTIPTSQKDIMSWKNLINNYWGLIIQTDIYVHKIYKQLEESGMLDSVSVMLLSDHGDEMSSHGLKQKGYHYESGTNVCCLVYSPEIYPDYQGTESHVIGSLLDVNPTLEELAHIKKRSTSFMGKSLITVEHKQGPSCPCGKRHRIRQLLPRAVNEPVFNIYNSWMSYVTYFYAQATIAKMPPEQKNKVLKQRAAFASFYNYLGFFTMIIDEINGERYKLARYFNFTEIILFNYAFNPNLQSFNVAKLADFDYSKFTQVNILKGPVDGLKKMIPKYNSVPELMNAPMTDTQRMIMVYALAKNLQYKDNVSIILIPGLYPLPTQTSETNNFKAYYADPDQNYYFFLHSLTKDPEEVVNLIDRQSHTPTKENLAIAAEMNKRLNQLIIKYDCLDFQIIIPDDMILSIAICYELFTSNTARYTDVQMDMITSAFGLATTDMSAEFAPYLVQTIAAINAANPN